MRDLLSTVHYIAGQVSLYAAIAAGIGTFLFLCHLVGPAFVLVPLTIFALAWAFA